MRRADIIEGSVYEISVDGRRVAVRVVAVRYQRSGKSRTLWRCTPVDTKRALPRARESSAIHPRSI